MGIHGLSKLLADHAPSCRKEQKFESYFGRKVAVDASMHIYQYMAVVGRMGDQQLTNEAGEVTSHLQGMFMRTIRMLEAGIKPVYVFDGKPPQFKSEELARRKERAAEADKELAAAKEAGDQEAIEKFSKRTIKVTKEHNEECKKLLRLMGLPVIEAPCEAEAQCASMCKEGLVYGVATEDMDCLTFACPKQLRHFMAPSSQNKPIEEFDYPTVIRELDITEDQFVDLCILCGCDYVNSIRGIGPVTALKLIREHKTIEEVVKAQEAKGEKAPSIPEGLRQPMLDEVRQLFKKPEVLEGSAVPAIKWGAPQEKALIDFLVHEKSFSQERVESGIKRMVKAKGKSNQGRMENFFKAMPSAAPKRKAPEPAKGKGKKPALKKGKAGGVGGGKKK